MERSHPTAPVEATRSRRRPFSRARATAARLAAAGVLTVSAPGCEGFLMLLDLVGNIFGNVKAGDVETTGQDPRTLDIWATDPDTNAMAWFDTRITTGANTLGGSWTTELIVDGADTKATTTIEETICMTATTEDISKFQSMQFQFEKTCFPAGVAGTFDLAVKWDPFIDGVKSAESFEWTASGNCADRNFTTSGPPAVVENTPNFRYSAFLQESKIGAIALQPGQAIRMEYAATVSAELGAGGAGSKLEVTGGYSGTIDVADRRSCTPPECSEDEDCDDDEMCEHDRCVPLRFGGKVSLKHIVLTGDLDAAFDFEDFTGQLQWARITIPKDAVQHNPVTTPNQGVGIVTLSPLRAPSIMELVQATGGPTVDYFADVDNDTIFEPSDVAVDFNQVGDDFTIEVTNPNGGDGTSAIRTYAAGSLRMQFFSSVLGIAQTGTYPITVTTRTIDPDSIDGKDNGTGRPPLEETFLFELKDGVITAIVGDRDGDGSPDDVDGCPDDGNKTAPGACGCGVADAEEGSACDTGEPGVCEPGTLVCDAGASECEPNVAPSVEICNGLDDDCDGTADDSNPGGGLACDTGQPGVCAQGTTICDPNAIAVLCVPDDGPSVELPCNRRDDDCNGVVDGACLESAPTALGGVITYDPRKADNDKVGMKLTFSSAGHDFDPAADGIDMTIESATATATRRFPAGTRGARATAAGWTTKISKNGNRKWTFKDAKDGSLGEPGIDAATVSCNAKKQICTAKVSAKKVDLPAFETGETTVELTTGDDRISDTRIWELKSKGKKFVAAKDP
jgi:hypothetical protein